MRAMFVLAAVLSLAAPGISARAFELSSPSSVTISISAPMAAPPQLHRAVAKHEKAFGFGLAIVPADIQPLYPPYFSVDGHTIGTFEPPNLDLNGPPLAPRPPPRS